MQGVLSGATGLLQRMPSVRSERLTARAGCWQVPQGNAAIVLQAHGLSESVDATGVLHLTPDYDIYCWLTERWLRNQREDRWVEFTLQQVCKALYAREADAKDRRRVRESIGRLRRVVITLRGYDAETGQLDQRFVTDDNLFDRLVSEIEAYSPEQLGAIRGSTFKVQLAPWLCARLAAGQMVRLDWDVLRSFHNRQNFAKRLWIYLQAENWKRISTTHEATYIVIGDRLFDALGIRWDPSSYRQARAMLGRSCKTVFLNDMRFTDGYVEVRKIGSKYRIHAERLTAATWIKRRPELEERAAIRREVQQSLRGR